MQTSSSEVIRLEHITKKYRTGQRQLQFWREFVWDGAMNLMGRNHNHVGSYINALDDVSFSVKKGERVAIIGQNGSGKSTCLKVIAGVTKASSGKRTVVGSLGTLIEVTVGFQTELTGKENVSLSGVIQGLSKQQIRERYDDIVAFSGLSDLNGVNWLNTPVKWYSSGMLVRLGFSVTAFLEPEILIIDEALAVGDAVFQEKCLKRMSEIADSGKTVVFVTHGMESAKSLCQRGIVLERGKVVMDGGMDSAARYYAESQKGGNNEGM